MRAFLRWMRQVLPRDTIVAGAVAADLAIEFTYLLSMFWAGVADEAAFQNLRFMVQLFAAFMYGGHRVATFHPGCDVDYRQWLESTPWTPRHPLPMGPL